MESVKFVRKAVELLKSNQMFITFHAPNSGKPTLHKKSTLSIFDKEMYVV